MNILDEIRSRFREPLSRWVEDPEPYLAMVRRAQDTRFGDIQANFAMPLAKRVDRNARELAAEIVTQVDVSDLCEQPEVAGPGFINLRLRTDWLEQATMGLVTDERLGHVAVSTARTSVVDYSAPNVAKPMHVGHLRSTVIGDSLCRLLRFQGHRVVGDNHIGDWGTQFGMLIFGYKHFLDAEAFRREPVQELARLYRLVHQLASYHEARRDLPAQQERLAQLREQIDAAEKAPRVEPKQRSRTLKKLRKSLDEVAERCRQLEAVCAAVESSPELKSLADAYPDIAEQARAETAKLHAGDEENRRLWERFLPSCLDALQRLYDRLGITFDLTLGESFYQPMLEDVVEELKERGIATDSEGAVCVFVEGNEAPLIIRKRDGAFTYATTDLATIKYRREKLKAESILYVVDARQSEHFRLVFEIARRWGFGDIDFRHVRFGTVLGRDGKPFKTRSGDTVGLESLLDEAVARARAIVDENDDAKPDGPELDEATRAAVAEVVGIGGIKYADLKHNRESDYVFDWDKMLAKNGDSATYIQYAYARICGIFRKGRIDREELRRGAGPVRIERPVERALVVQILQFPEAVDAAAAECRPNFLAQYLFETANRFTAFYDECQILPERDAERRRGWLLLCDLTARALKLGLELLGIAVCERM